MTEHVASTRTNHIEDVDYFSDFAPEVVRVKDKTYVRVDELLFFAQVKPSSDEERPDAIDLQLLYRGNVAITVRDVDPDAIERLAKVANHLHIQEERSRGRPSV
jgi:hypothetical protein